MVEEVTKQIIETEDYQGSPIEYIYDHKTAIRQSLIELPDNAHSVLHSLKAQGLTDYYACPIEFSNGPINVCTFATNAKNGFF